MGAGHAHKLYRHGHSPVHALPPHCKLAAVFCFVLVVVSTPREAMWAFGCTRRCWPPSPPWPGSPPASC